MSKKLQFVEQTIDSRGVAVLSLNRAEKNNALNAELIAELTQCLLELADNKQIRVLLLQGHGKHFCAGADLKSMASMKDKDYQQNLDDALCLAELFSLINTFPKPTVVKIQGAVYGGGLGLIACCDIAIVAADSLFCFSEVKLGLSPATICPYVVAAIGERAARRYLLSGETFASDRAHAMGLVHEVVAVDDLEENVNTLIDTLVTNGPIAMMETKALIQKTAKSELSIELKQSTAELIARLRTSSEGQEGLAAFFEKRSPRWK